MLYCQSQCLNEAHDFLSYQSIFLIAFYQETDQSMLNDGIDLRNTYLQFAKVCHIFYDGYTTLIKINDLKNSVILSSHSRHFALLHSLSHWHC